MGEGKQKGRLGVLASGKGSNLQAIIDAAEKGELDARIAVVISDVEDAYALERARKHKVEAVYIPPGKYKTWLEPEVEEKYVGCLKEHGVDLVILAGFMRVIKPVLLDAYKGRMINIHPSLLPAFPGLESWKQALEYGAKVTGCTVHFVDSGMDTGPIIVQESVPVKEDDTPETLHARIQVKEHIIYPLAISLFLEGKLKVEGRGVIIK